MKKKIWRFAITLAFCMMTSVSLWADKPEGQRKTDNLDLVFIGNSITYGATLGNPGTQAPPVRVKEILSDKMANDVNIVNCGHSGSTTLNWLPGTSFMNEAINGAKSLQEDGGNLFFSIMLGTNDSAESGPTGSPVSTTTYKANMLSIINKLYAEFPNARVILNYPLWYSPNTHNGAVYLQAGLDRLNSYKPIINEVISELQAQGRKIYAGSNDAYSFFENNNKMFTSEAGNSGTFYLHPNKEGAIKLAEFWANSILEHAQDIITNDSIAVKLNRMISEGSEKAESIYKRTPGLLSDWKQITTNASGNDNPKIPNNLAHLIDGNRSTTYQTWPSFPEEGYAYLQFDLTPTPVSSVYIDMSPWQDGSYGLSDMPKIVKFSLSADGGETWAKDIDYTFEIKPSFGLGDTYKSDLINLGGTYNTIRMTMIEHQSDRYASHPKLFGMSQFQLYALHKDAPSRDAEIKAAGEELVQAVQAAEAAFAQETYDEETIATLQSALDAFDAKLDVFNQKKKDELKNYVKGKKLITQASQLTTNCTPLADFSLANLIDGNDRNIYHSWSGANRTERCWIGVELQEPCDKIYLYYTPHKYRQWGLVEQDNPAVITVLGSNDNERWTTAMVLDKSMGMPTEVDENYSSPLLDLGNAYKYLRFRIDRTLGNRGDGESVIVTLAEMQLYEAIKMGDATFVINGNTLVIKGNVDATALTKILADNPNIPNIDLCEATLHTSVTPKVITSAISGNQLVFVPSSLTLLGKNIVRGNKCLNLVLSDESTFLPKQDIAATKVTFERNITDNKWSTLVLPFSYAVPSNVVMAHNPMVKGSTLSLTQYKAGEIVPAYQPVMVKAEEPTTLTLTAKNAKIVCADSAIDMSDNQILLGTLSSLDASNLDGAYVVGDDGNTFVKPADSAEILPLHAYLVVPDSESDIITISDDLTAVKPLNSADADQASAVYTADGKKVRSQASAANPLGGLSKGVYIYKGRKVKK